MQYTRSRSDSRPIALFVGAHPDDIELGAGATAARLSAQNWIVWFLVLTSEADENVAELRKLEAAKAAITLGVDPCRLLFAEYS
jgi:LmbE family N-acetylglucosaminyl deacetylase